MALFYSPVAKTQKNKTIAAKILDLDYQGRGVAKIEGKTWFISNALPQEQVQCVVIDEKRHYGQAIAQHWFVSAPERQTPPCLHYEQCGGCQSQHIPIVMQRSAKQRALFHQLSRLQPSPIQKMPILAGEPWRYRRRVRLSIVINPKNGRPEMGFRQARSNYVVNIVDCLVADARFTDLIAKLTALLPQWSVPKTLGHVELVAADNGVAMLLRVIGNLSENDRTLLVDFARGEQIMLFVQDDRDVHHLSGELPYYEVTDGIKLQFDLHDFIQVNADLNRQMIQTALDWLAPSRNDNVLDLFCGMGNFTLPLSKYVKSAVGIEGVSEMVDKACDNAKRNGCENVRFFQADLTQSFISQPWAATRFNKILLDPPRSGAAFALNALCQLGAERILYVSCNPSTLVRDAEILLQAGYKIDKIAAIDMFPQTGHLESVTLFRKPSFC